MDSNTEAARRVGTTLCNKWTLERLLGTGGMAAVYVARHKIGRLDAIKILHADIAMIADVRARFEQEALAVNRFRHPGAVEIRDIDATEDGAPFLVMELLDGESLLDRVERLQAIPLGELLAKGRFAQDRSHELTERREQRRIPSARCIVREGQHRDRSHIVGGDRNGGVRDDAPFAHGAVGGVAHPRVFDQQRASRGHRVSTEAVGGRHVLQLVHPGGPPTRALHDVLMLIHEGESGTRCARELRRNARQSVEARFTLGIEEIQWSSYEA